MKQKCNIIKDLLPLYADEICSEESKREIEEHLSECESCKNELHIIKENIFIENESEEKADSLFAAGKAMKKSKHSSFIKGLVIALSFSILIFLSYLGYHFFTSSVSDTIDLQNLISKEKKETAVFIEKQVRKGNYLAILCRNDSDEQFVMTFEKDPVFKSRWRNYHFGVRSIKHRGEIHCTGMGYMKTAVILAYGIDLPKDASYFWVETNGTIYTSKIENGVALDIIIVDDTYDINSSVGLLDDRFNAIDG